MMKPKTMAKKTLSVILCVVMLVSCWVFTAPDVHANQTDGKYTIKIEANQTTSEGWASETYLYLDYDGGTITIFNPTKWSGEQFGGYNQTKELSGFPTQARSNAHCWGVRKTNGLHIKVSVLNYDTNQYVTILEATNTHQGNSDQKRTHEVSAANKPSKYITDISGDSTVNIPADGSTVTSSAYSAQVKDQYGYIYTAPTISCTPPNDVTWANNRFSCTNANNSSGDYTATVTASSSGLTSKTKTVTFITFDYTVNFKSEDGSSTYTNNVSSFDYGAQIAYGGTKPTKTSTAQYEYTFDGWSATIGGDTVSLPTAKGASPKTYYAHFSAALRKYNITFAYKKASNDNTSLVDASIVRQNVNYGTTPTAPTAVDTVTDAGNQIPRVIVTTTTTYTFDHWDATVSSVTGTKTYNAVYTSSRTPYNITFKWVNPSDVSGALLEQTTAVGHGLTPTTPDNIPDYEDNVGTNTFDYWNPEVTSVSAAATYIAQYRVSRYNNYTITFHDAANGQDSVSTLHWGDPITVPKAAKAADAHYTYTFSHWVAGTDVTGPAVTPATNVAGDAEYTAVYSKTVNKYTITYLKSDGTTYRVVENVPYGTVPAEMTGEDAVPALITRPSNATYHYTASWDNDINTAIKGDITFRIIDTPEAHEAYLGEATVTKESTCKETGLKEQTCSACNYVVQTVIPIAPNAHAWQRWDGCSEEKISELSGAVPVVFKCQNGCGNYCAATYDEEAKKYNPTENFGKYDDVKGYSDQIPTPSFNEHFEHFDGQVEPYKYSDRKASLRVRPSEKDDPTQAMRFSGNLSAGNIIGSVDFNVNPTRIIKNYTEDMPAENAKLMSLEEIRNNRDAYDDNTVIDFGFVFTQARFIRTKKTEIDYDLMTLDNIGTNYRIYRMSVVGNNLDNFRDGKTIENWKGLTMIGEEATFNLVIDVNEKNYQATYVARTYVIYKYHGDIICVYDQPYENYEWDDEKGEDVPIYYYSHDSVYNQAEKNLALDPQPPASVIAYLEDKIINNTATQNFVDWNLKYTLKDFPKVEE